MSRIIIAPGASAPNFTSPALVDGGVDISFQFIPNDDRYKLLFFYNGDFKDKSADEIKQLNYYSDEFKTFDCDIYGISIDSVDVHLAWNDIVKTKFPLFSDISRRVSLMYGSLSPEGQCYSCSFIIDKRGKILWYCFSDNKYPRNISHIREILPEILT